VEKKTAHASEQDRPDILKRREEWFDGQLDLDPERLVFIDETWASTNMARRYGRAPRGERLRVGVPHGHWKTTTFVAGLRLTGMVAPMVLDGPINGVSFQAYIDQVLVPELRPSDIVIMDNLGSHKGAGVRAAIEAAACCARQPKEPSMGCGTQSARCCRRLRRRNAPTSLPPPAMSQHERKSL